MHRSRPLIVVAVLCAIGGTACTSPPAPASERRSPSPLQRPIAGPLTPSSEERAVYEAAVSRFLQGWVDEESEPTPPTFVVHPTTVTLSSLPSAPADSAWAPSVREAWAEFAERNQKRYVIPADLGLGPRVQVPDLEPEGPHDARPWDTLLERYPDVSGFLMLSRIGFSEGQDAAVVEIGAYRGDFDGGGARFVLLRRDGQWLVERETLTWVM